jgi:hypothetical protein
MITIVITSYFQYFSLLFLKKDGIPCNTSASNGTSFLNIFKTNVFLVISGKYCSRKGSTYVELTRISNSTSRSFRFQYFSFEYMGQSNSDVITFAFDKGRSWYLDDLSGRDILTNAELIDNGGFESGILNTYCVCSGDFCPSTTTIFLMHTGSYAYDPSNFFSAVKLSQSLDTIPRRNYNVSFWLNKGSREESPLTVYIS